MTLFNFGESRPWSGRTTQGAVGDAGPYSSADWQELYRNFMPFAADFQAGVIAGSNEAQSGVFGTARQPLKVVATSPASNAVTVQPGSAFVQGIWYYLDTSFNITIQANASGNARIDAVILRADYNGQTVRPYYVQGTPAVSPTTPGLTQNSTFWEIAIAYVNVASGFTTIATTAIEDARQKIVPDSLGLSAAPQAGGGYLAYEQGLPIIISSVSTPFEVFTSNLQGDQRAMGVTEKFYREGVLGDDTLRITSFGVAYVEVNQATTVGQFLEQSATTGQARPTTRPEAAFGRALESVSNAGDKVLALVWPSGKNIDPYCAFADVKAVNTAGGTFTAGAWQTRTLTTETFDTNGLSSLAANRFSLQPGVWYIRARAPGYRCDHHMIRLQNITAGATTNRGTAEYSPSAADSSQTFATMAFEFSISVVSTFEIQHYCTTTRATDGFGTPANIDSLSEVYTSVELWRKYAAP